MLEDIFAHWNELAAPGSNMTMYKEKPNEYVRIAVCDALQSKIFSRGPCNVQTRSWSRRSHSVSQLLPRFLENLLCFGEFVEQLIG